MNRSEQQASHLKQEEVPLGKAVSSAVRATTSMVINQIESCKQDVSELEEITDKIGELYHEFSKDVLKVSGLSSATSKKWDELAPYLKEIDEISKTVDGIEKTVEELNDFVTGLEVRWEKLQQS